MPDLLLRVRIAGHHDVDDVLDVVAVVEPTHRVDELLSAIATHVGAAPSRLWVDRLGRPLEGELPVERSGLVSGDTVAIGAPPEPAPAAARSAPDDEMLAVDVVAGPDSGSSHPVRRPGRYSLGRATDSSIRFSDPSVSRDHATLTLGVDGGMLLHPSPGAANGVHVNGREISSEVAVGEGDVVGLGGSRFVLRAAEPVDRDPTDHFGQIDFHRTPYRPRLVADRAVDPFGPIPVRPEPRRLQLLAVLAPLAAGAAMYAFTRHAQFLVLTLVSPVVMVGTVIDDRRSGRRRFRRRLDEFRRAIIERRRELELLRDEEHRERFHSAPDVAALIRRAETRSVDLWARGRGAVDFLHLRLGLGPSIARFPIDLERGGDDDLRAEAAAAFAGLDHLECVPVVVDLVADPIVGLHGGGELVAGVAASLLVQVATLHSPDDLVIAVGAHPDRTLGWAKWLPHTRSVTSPLPGSHVADTTDDVDGLIRRLTEVADHRLADRTGRSDPVPVWPRLLVVLDAALDPDPAEVARLLDRSPAAGIGVLWLADVVAAVPRQATRTLDVGRTAGASMRGRLWATDPSVPDVHLEIEHLRPHIAERAALALAPVRDASTASLATSIPRRAPLFDVLGIGRPTAGWISEHWMHGPGDGLAFPLGLGPEGPIVVDLVEDGPHTLIGGTSGAGKSELLQSMVASLAAHHPPTRLNVLFVDYKGGACSQAFGRLPHAVGAVTNLDPELANRALTSLRAELHHRMAILDGRAKDLDELRRIAPDDAPPSLVIVVDEFATLVKEVPEFVTGIVDLAQRGRSLGIHLVLATQRPSGSVDENILANTSLRISLRMLDRAESTAIVGLPDAADIPVPLRGRAMVRSGSGRPLEFQSAYASAPVTSAGMRPPVLVGSFDVTDATARPPAGGEVADETQLAVLLDAVAEAHTRLRLPPPRRPWCDVLPTTLPLDRVLSEAVAADRAAGMGAGRFVTIGMLDDPERQAQRPAVVDLEEGGGLLVFGSGGSGTTTTLRTIAASIVCSDRADRADRVGVGVSRAGVAIVAFDLAGRGLAALAALPEVVAAVPGDDLEAVTRQLIVLDAELDRRRRRFAAVGAEHLTAYAAAHPDAPPRVVVLVDGFGALAPSLSGGPVGVAEEWPEHLVRLVTDGRQVGLHVVIAADRRAAVPARIHAAVANRLVLRHADATSYADHGVPAHRAVGLTPGRGFLHGETLVQIATVSADPSAQAQSEAIRVLGERSSVAREPLLAGEALPALLAEVDRADRLQRVPIGVADVTGERVDVDLDWSGLTVCGAPRTGRSTALGLLAAQLAPIHDVTVVGPSSSPLRTGADGLAGAFGDAAPPVLERLANRVVMDGADGPIRVLVVDDADLLDDPAVLAPLERLTRLDRVRIVAGIESRSMSSYSPNALVNAARRSRRLLVLGPDDPGEFLQVTGVKLQVRPGLRMLPGRGVLLIDRVPTVIQVATGVAAAPASPVPADLDRPLEPEPVGRAERLART